MSAERLVKDWRKLISANCELPPNPQPWGNQASPQSPPILGDLGGSSPIALSLICFHLAQQRSIVPPLPAANLHDHVCESLEVLRERGLPIPQSWLHPLRLSDALTAALLDRLPVDAPIELLAQVYELLQRPEQKQSQGSFYTPIAIADYIVSQSICLPRPRLLDPACGGGILLLRAYAKLLEIHADCDRFSLLQCCIFGIDIDTQAVAIAQISLLLKAAEGCTGVSTRFPDLSQNICCGNAVIHPIAAILKANSFD
ncbi:MAG: SAM-dependent DNA methyltransferase, partial [Microcoleus sp. SIO2G3]|nr:SAM-dependent DNA methyltransferase [Microcoleus sp. SIO2G3]